MESSWLSQLPVSVREFGKSPSLSSWTLSLFWGMPLGLGEGTRTTIRGLWGRANSALGAEILVLLPGDSVGCHWGGRGATGLKGGFTDPL